jgi:hypothetical protein
MSSFEFYLARLSGYLFCAIPEIRESQLDPRSVLNHLQLPNQQFDGTIFDKSTYEADGPVLERYLDGAMRFSLQLADLVFALVISYFLPLVVFHRVMDI